MEKVENGIFVSVDYKGTLEDGQVFDTSHGRQPLEIQMGAGQLIKGFENELMGMALNEKKVFTLAPDDAYGQRDENLIAILSQIGSSLWNEPPGRHDHRSHHSGRPTGTRPNCSSGR